MSGRKTTSWNPQVHEDILVALLTVAKITPQQLSEAMKALTAQGYTFTESALKQHIAKLQKKEGNGVGTPAKATPAKKTPASGKRKTPTKKVTPAPTDDEVDDDEDIATPSKKAKTKVEADDGDIKHPSAIKMDAEAHDNDYEI